MTKTTTRRVRTHAVRSALWVRLALIAAVGAFLVVTATAPAAHADAAPAPPAADATDRPAPDAARPDVSRPDVSGAGGSAPQGAAADGAQQHGVSVLVLDVVGAELTEDQRNTLTALVAAQVARFPSARVLTSVELRTLVNAEAERQSAGCSDDGLSCMAELAGALNADLVVAARAGKLNDVLVATFQVFDAKKGAVVGRASAQAWGLDELVPQVEPAVIPMLRTVLNEEPGTTTSVTAGKKPVVQTGGLPLTTALKNGLTVGGGVTAAVGAVAMVLGAAPAVLHGRQKQDLYVLTTQYAGDPADIDRAVKLRAAIAGTAQLWNGPGRLAVIGGSVVLVAGAAALVAGLLATPTDAPAPDAPAAPGASAALDASAERAR